MNDNIINLRSRVSKRKYSFSPIYGAEIVTKGVDNLGQAIRSDGEGKTCLVCASRKSIYTCPNCFVHYCCSACYKQHNVDCTEEFSRERVKQVLDLEKKEMQSCPQVRETGGQREENHGEWEENEVSTKEGEVEEVEGGEELEYLKDKLLDKLEANNADLSSLNREEMELLCQASGGYRVLQGQFKKLWHPWHPWWKDVCVQIHVPMEEIRSGCPKLSSLMKDLHTNPHLLSYQILGMLIGYVVTLRTFNGDWLHDKLFFEVVEMMWSCNPSLRRISRGRRESNSRQRSEQHHGQQEQHSHFQLNSVSDTVDAFRSIYYSTGKLISPTEKEISKDAYHAQSQSPIHAQMKEIQDVLHDCVNILSLSWHGVSYVLTECWLMAMATCITPTAESTESERTPLTSQDFLSAFNMEHFLPIASDFLSTRTQTSAASLVNMMDCYKDNKFLHSMQSNVKSLHLHAEILARKSYFLLLGSFEDIQIRHFESLRDEISLYVKTMQLHS